MQGFIERSRQLRSALGDLDGPSPPKRPRETASDGDPDTVPGTRAAHQNETENNAVAKTTVAVDEADPEPEADAPVAGRSQVNE